MLADLIAALKQRTVGFHQLAEDLEKEGLKEDMTAVIELPSTVKRHAYMFDSPSVDSHPTFNTRELSLLHSNENMAKIGSSKGKCNSIGGSVFLAIIILMELYLITCAYIYTHVLPKDYSHYAIGRGLEVTKIRERTSVILYTIDQQGKAYTTKVEPRNVPCELIRESTCETLYSRCKVKKIKRTQFEISYQVSDLGRYQLHIKVEKEHIKGSPFTVTAIRKFSDPHPEVSYMLEHQCHSITIDKCDHFLFHQIIEEQHFNF